MTVDGKKISGSAQKIANGRVLHHGTLLFDADLTRLDEITDRPEKRRVLLKGMQSAICAVTNLRPHLREDCEIVTFARQLAQKILPSRRKDRPPHAGAARRRPPPCRGALPVLGLDLGKTPAFTYEKDRGICRKADPRPL